MLLAGSVAQAGSVLECPATIEVKESLQSALPEGWIAQDSETRMAVFGDAAAALRNLGGMTLYSGNPKEGASLAPDEDEDNGEGGQAVWRFAEGDAIWLLCWYRDTGMTLAKPLPAYKECRLAYTTGAGQERMECE